MYKAIEIDKNVMHKYTKMSWIFNIQVYYLDKYDEESEKWIFWINLGTPNSRLHLWGAIYNIGYLSEYYLNLPENMNDQQVSEIYHLRF